MTKEVFKIGSLKVAKSQSRVGVTVIELSRRYFATSFYAFESSNAALLVSSLARERR